MTRDALAVFSRKLAIAFACCLPFLVPFGDAPRNIDMQGLVLVLAGAAGWTAVLLGEGLTLRRPRSSSEVLLLVFAACCVLSLIFNPHFGYGLLGAPYIRLGAAGLLACMGCGLALRSVPVKQLTVWLYVIICMLALAAVPYSWLRLHDLARIGGLFAQADIFAVFLGCGLLIGTQLLRHNATMRRYLLASQALLFGLLVLSGTRAVLALVIILLPFCWQQARHGWSARTWLFYIGVIAVIVAAGQSLLPSRVTNTGYARASLHYRLDLQSAGVRAAWQKPLLGYGPGNLADALDCSKLSAPALLNTCRNHYFFNSSHNIFLDRAMAIGWIGGLSYLALVVSGIWKGFRARQEFRVITCCLLLISLYYLSNVTAVPLELLLWILLLRILEPSRA